ncbi:MAG: type II toxin-antitoxin system VapC family toxin [Candidatus Jordarchaeaceae archaeon]
MLVVDSSVFVDFLFEKNEAKNRMAKELLESIEDLLIFVPRIFLLELVSVEGRLNISLSKKDVEELTADFEVLSEDFLFDEAFKVVQETHSRAVDSYFISAAKLTSSALVSCDKRMIENAKKFGVKAYYLPEELDKIIKIIKEVKDRQVKT